MKTFVLQKSYGMVVIRAEDKERALELLKIREGADPCFSFKLETSEFKDISDSPEGVVFYMGL